MRNMNLIFMVGRMCVSVSLIFRLLLCLLHILKKDKDAHRIKQASASTAYYDKSTLAFRPTIPPLHDVELNPGPENCSTTNKFKKVIAHLNIRLLKCCEHRVLVKEGVLENKFDIFTISETWLNNSGTEWK